MCNFEKCTWIYTDYKDDGLLVWKGSDGSTLAGLDAINLLKPGAEATVRAVHELSKPRLAPESEQCETDDCRCVPSRRLPNPKVDTDWGPWSEQAVPVKVVVGGTTYTADAPYKVRVAEVPGRCVPKVGEVKKKYYFVSRPDLPEIVIAVGRDEPLTSDEWNTLRTELA